MPELLQHVLVTIAALVAAWVILRRVVSVVRPATGESKCAGCPSAARHAGAQPVAPARAKPLALVNAGPRTSSNPSAHHT